MIVRQRLIVLLLLLSFFSCSKAQKKYNCTERIDQLYKQQKIHLIFCSYYFNKANTFSKAEKILDNNLSFYRDTINANIITKKDSAIVSNLKKGICNRDTSLITEIYRWCEASRKAAQIRSEVNFTLEGYMEFLNSLKETKSLFASLPKNGRTIYSLSTNEMEWIYFTSIDIIKNLKAKERDIFLKKMRSWSFE